MLKDEHTLVIGLKSGSEESYRALYDLWFSRLYQFVLRYVKSEPVTDDIVQETFLNIWIYRESINPCMSFKSYLFTIAYHFLIKELRRQLNTPLMKDYVAFCSELSTCDNETVEKLELKQFQDSLNRAKEKLSPRQRQIFELNKEGNATIAEIAASLSITEQVVRNQLSAALKIVRKELRQYPYLLLLFLSL
ncbi:MAG TPA: sigma-70 family RNA polymerase sigma factor [Candidatus Bacteroides merdavium]|uniref:RNA polymerase sigma factor n=1 Tax=Candidatus Bacteroides merdavium TaxID=2838472 RepID=A0A9D2GVN7_9BACE|nr:sigma-70 family RNA polymerase sigma factor [Candidatus Bacteroides merdavium]